MSALPSSSHHVSDPSDTTIDTVVLAARVRHYLKSNQIHWTRFASLVLGVSQSRLSILLGKPRPWGELGRRVQALYERMQLWMDTRATYGNNPYQKEKQSVKRPRGGMRGSRMVAASRNKRPRSLFEVEENVELLTKQEDLTAMQMATKQEDITAVENMMEELNGGCNVVEDGLTHMNGGSKVVEDGLAHMNGSCNVVEDGLAHIDWEDELGLAPPAHFETNTETVEMVPVPTDTQVFSVMILEENLEEPGTYLLSIPEVPDVEDGEEISAD